MNSWRTVRRALYRRRAGSEPASDGWLRDALLRPAGGRVVEIGAGDGRSLRCYAEVDVVVAVEARVDLAAASRQAGIEAGCPSVVVSARAEALPFRSGAFDAAVAIHALCAVDDPAATLVELDRIVRRGGELRFLEHVLARSWPAAGAQRLLGRVWPAFDGCHCDRDTVTTIVRTGWRVTSLERFSHWPRLINLPIAPHAMGVATPGAGEP